MSEPRHENSDANLIKDPTELHGNIFENVSHVHNRADIFKVGSEKHDILHGGDGIFDKGGFGHGKLKHTPQASTLNAALF